MPFKWTPTGPNDEVTVEQIKAICNESERAIHNIKTILPHFDSLLRQRYPEPDDPKAITDRMLHFKWFGDLVSRFEYMYKRHCGPAGRKPNGAYIPKVKADFDHLVYALPFHALLEITIKRETDFDRKEDEYHEKYKEMCSMIDMIKAKAEEHEEVEKVYKQKYKEMCFLVNQINAQVIHEKFNIIPYSKEAEEEWTKSQKLVQPPEKDAT